MPDVVAPPPSEMSEWKTRSGFVLATIGSAVGIGSIWKFPYEVGANGGGALSWSISPGSRSWWCP